MPTLQTVRSGLNYLKPTHEVPCSYAFEPPAGTPWENCEYELLDVDIRDGRHTASSLDREGFALHTAPSRVASFAAEEQIRSVYYAECEALALQLTGGRRALVFDHLLRRADRAQLNFGRRRKGEPAAANGRIHNDYTEASGKRRLAMVLGDPAEVATVGRYCILNFWRSVAGPVRDMPLAVCDARSIQAAELVAGQVRYPRRTGEIYYLLHSTRHRWSYFSEMQRDEVLVFKQYDSQVSGTTRFTPHAAFTLPDIAPDTPPRESIELRCLVVLD
ncbi:MAG: methyltransferase [Burkholderiaceae bacterium]|nr:methyltransferase [Burkholderiaceae bacterium]